MEHTHLCEFAEWFDVHFRGRSEDPAQQEIELTTAPSSNNDTQGSTRKKKEYAS